MEINSLREKMIDQDKAKLIKLLLRSVVKYLPFVL